MGPTRDASRVRRGADGPTFPAIEPRQRIDAVFPTPDLVVDGASVPGGPAVEVGSDHRPIVVDLR